MSNEPQIERPAAPPGWADAQVELVMGRLLQVGVVLAASIVLIGGIVFLLRHGSEPVDLSHFHGEPEKCRNPGDILQAVTALSARGTIQLGLLLLVATPVARVAFSVYAFARQKDRMYVVFTLIVLTTLVFSLVWGDF
jgi:uncharacterized membrane protein